MSKPILVFTGKTHIDEKGRRVKETAFVDKPAPCKNCRRNPRKDHSAYCEPCTREYREKTYEEERFRKRVEGASKKN